MSGKNAKCFSIAASFIYDATSLHLQSAEQSYEADKDQVHYEFLAISI